MWKLGANSTVKCYFIRRSNSFKNQTIYLSGIDVRALLTSPMDYQTATKKVKKKEFMPQYVHNVTETIHLHQYQKRILSFLFLLMHVFSCFCNVYREMHTIFFLLSNICHFGIASFTN